MTVRMAMRDKKKPTMTAMDFHRIWPLMRAAFEKSATATIPYDHAIKLFGFEAISYAIGDKKLRRDGANTEQDRLQWLFIGS